MSTLTMYHIALVAHIVGLTIMAGTTLQNYIISQQIWKYVTLDKPKGLAIYGTMSKSTMLFGIGILLLIISGVSMMGITHGAFGEQIWFRIKFGLVIIIIINGIAIGRRQHATLKKILSDDTAGNNETRVLKIKRNTNWFHLSQLTLFLIVFSLSVFKFN